MANTVIKTKISDGPQKAIFSYYLESDGVEGELNNYVLVDPQADFSDYTGPQSSIMQVWYGFSSFDGLITFDDVVPYPGWELRHNAGTYYDFRYFGGLKDRAGLDHTGKLYLSTKDFATLGSIGTLVIEIKKD